MLRTALEALGPTFPVRRARFREPWTRTEPAA